MALATLHAGIFAIRKLDWASSHNKGMIFKALDVIEDMLSLKHGENVSIAKAELRRKSFTQLSVN